MQRDQKVGLALGVLLIGVVAAFFFRNEPEPGRSVPSLEHAARVDREISEKRLTPYFAEIETDEPGRGTPARNAASSRGQNDHRTGERKLPRWEEALKEADRDPFAGENDVPAPAPDPIQYETKAAPVATRQPENRPLTERPEDDSLSTAAPPASDTAALRVHEVQRGETLSSIAGKHLGSQTRFHEIFAANRDQLQDANDLKVGMKLRIPEVAAKPAVSTGVRAKKSPESTPLPAPPLDIPESAFPIIESDFSPLDEPAGNPELPAEDEPPVVLPIEPGKLKFSPAKRRPARAGG